MVSTRSSTKQSRVDDPHAITGKREANTNYSTTTTAHSSQRSKQQPKPEEGRTKRKATATAKRSDENIGPPSKKVKSPATKTAKQQHLTPSDDDATNLKFPTVITINRSPVLQLWGACVAEFMHPELTWQACLSIGSTISTLCAVSKGRSIGKIESKDGDVGDDQAEKKKKNEREKAKDDTNQYEVMGFPIFLKDDKALVSGKPKPPNEANLVSKFSGDEQYQSVRKAMADALESWHDDSESLDKNAFHMYEKFRPNVAPGQRGWGRKGELSIEEMQGVIRQH